MPKRWQDVQGGNCKGILLLEFTHKVMASIIKIRLRHTVEPQLGDYEEKGHYRLDIFMMKEVVTTCYQFKIPAFFWSILRKLTTRYEGISYLR